jgi:type II secretion system protein G
MKKGFTLIELLVVVSIIGFISSITLNNLAQARAKARDARRVQDLHIIRSALELYHSDNGHYPIVDTAGYFVISSTLNHSGLSWDALGTTLSKYISKLPNDPINNGVSIFPYSNDYAYAYLATPDGSDYDLLARTELSESYSSCPNSSLMHAQSRGMPICVFNSMGYPNLFDDH